ncbi:MAG: hypothetical protein U0893_14845 [Chloroflexota bacterium]
MRDWPEFLVPFDGSRGAEKVLRTACRAAPADRPRRAPSEEELPFGERPESGGESVLDLMFVAIVLVFFGLSFGYATFCDRL